MTRILTWAKRHQYQWEREDFCKVFDRLWWGMVVIGIGLVTVVALMYNLGVSREHCLLATAIGYIFLFANMGGAIAVKWADGKLKS